MEIKSIFKRLLGSDPQLAGEFDFHIEYQPKEPVLGDVISVSCFHSSDRQKALPVSFRWFKARRHEEKELRGERNSRLTVEPDLVRHSLRVEVTSLQPKAPGTAVINFPVVRLEPTLRRGLRKALMAESVEQQGFVFLGGKEKECRLTIESSCVKVFSPEKGVTFAFPYTLVHPLVLFRSAEPRSIVVRFAEESPALRQFLQQVFQQETASSPEPELGLRLPSALARNVFYFGTRAFATRRELVNSFTIHNIELEHIDEEKYDLLFEVGELNKELLEEAKQQQVLESQFDSLSHKYDQLSKEHSGSRQLRVEDSVLKSQVKQLAKGSNRSRAEEQQDKRSWQGSLSLSNDERSDYELRAKLLKEENKQLSRRLQEYKRELNQTRTLLKREHDQSDLQLLISCIEHKDASRVQGKAQASRVHTAPLLPETSDVVCLLQAKIEELTKHNSELIRENIELAKRKQEAAPKKQADKKTEPSEGELHRKLEQCEKELKNKQKVIDALSEKLKSFSMVLDSSNNLSLNSTTTRDNKLKARVDSLLLEVELLRKEREVLTAGRAEEVASLEEELQFFKGQYQRSTEERKGLLGENERMKKELQRLRKERRNE